MAADHRRPVLVFSDWNAQQTNPNSAHVLSSSEAISCSERNREGHYLADGEINGKPVTFLLETGANLGGACRRGSPRNGTAALGRR
jgi:hypothetical protein